MTKITSKQSTKDNPKVPISFRVPSKLKDALKEKAIPKKEHHIQSIEQLDYPIILKYTLGIIIFLFVFNRLFKWSKS